MQDHIHKTSRSDIYHHRGPVSESGLDIRYTLDLTRIAIHPTPATLKLVQRLTGVDLEDIIEEAVEAEDALETATLNMDTWTDHVAELFMAECVRRAPGAKLPVETVYRAFQEWYRRQDFSGDQPIPSMKRLNKRLWRAGFQRSKYGRILVHNLALVWS